MRFTKLNYCQYLLSSQINYTLTNLAEHLEQISHDKINRYLKNEKLTPRILWDNVKDLIEINDHAYLVFDDTVIDKRHAIEIEPSKRQYSGNEHGVIQGIGLVNCVYVNHEIGKFWVVDYRIYDPDRDGKTKIDHVMEMLQNLVYNKVLPFQSVLMDTWYATNKWKVEEFHRELKQLTGIESCQCRKGRIQRNHIACAILVWVRLKDLAYSTGQTIYQIKHGLLSNYLVQQLKRPDIPMFIA